MQTDQPDRTQLRRRGGEQVDPLPGRVLEGRYRVGPLVARGGMASVYEATDLRLDRTVAVKVVHAGLLAGTDQDQDDVAARFVREARAAARLSHPNVVAVFDQGDDDGVVFLAMEMVRGETLRDLLAREAPLPPGRALALLQPVLSALAAAHRAGVVHRDVKPENVLIAEDGTVKVADFGLARAVSADTRHATQGVLIGTVSYLAPELVVEGRADARADVYAAGVVLYELLTGSKPHEGESPIHVAYQHVHTDVPAPSARVPGLPAHVDALVARATARDRAQRPADADVLLRHVRRVALAVAEGVEDEELAADLRPVPPAGPVPPVSPGSGTPVIAAAPPAPPLPVPVPAPAPARGPAPTRPQDRSPVRAPLRRRGRRGPLVLVLALALVASAVGGAYWFGWARYTATPAVLGLSPAAAEQRLGTADLELEVVDEAWSETVPAGRVISTDPDPGSRVLPGGTVGAVVSRGQERYDVPRLGGRSTDAAQDRLLALRLDPDDTVERWSDTVPAGTVLRTRPAAGTTLRPGSPVDLVVSRGPRPRRVGDWVGRDLDEAATTLEGRGLVTTVTSEVFDDEVPEGAVVSQDPGSGRLLPGETVSFVVSRGPELVAVPDGVIAAGVEDATETLEAAGFEVEVANDDSFVGLGFVVGMDPGEGELVAPGSTIVLYLV